VSNTSPFIRSQAARLVLAIVSAAVFSLTPSLSAQAGTAPAPGPASGPQQPGAPPARAVRLSSVEGQVQLAQGNQILASQAVANTPLFEGMQITTADDGRAEVQFEDGSVARIPPNSSLVLTTLQQQGATMVTDLALNSGLGYFEIQGNSQAEQIRVHFGNAVVSANGFTVLRINLDYPPGEVAVFSGNAHVDSGTSLSLDMHGGESMKINGPDSGNYALAETIDPDSWDAWNSDRDQVLTAQEADRTEATNSLPNSNNPAWSDLDANGNWYNMPGQGYVWSPNEASSSNWDPYGCGSWVWNPSYSYTWASCEPWGYMPYASGMWNYYDGLGWAWAPGLGIPWWGGFGGWGYNIGNAPFHYRPPHRPVGGPRPGGGPIRPGGRYQPYPVVAVNRVPSIGAGTSLRPRNAPVTVAGNTLQPLRSLSPRPVYGAAEFGHGPAAYGYAGSGAHYGSAPGATVRWAPTTPSGAHPAPRYNTYAAPRSSAPSHPSYSAPASHPSGGGGGAAHGGGGGGGHR
jgi:FecR protein